MMSFPGDFRLIATFDYGSVDGGLETHSFISGSWMVNFIIEKCDGFPERTKIFMAHV
jgi:hypothetical protein